MEVILTIPMSSERLGLFYAGHDKEGVLHAGFLAPPDGANTVDLRTWHDALDKLTDPPDLRLFSLRVCSESKFLELVRSW